MLRMNLETGNWEREAVPAAPFRVVWGFGAFRDFESLEEAGRLYDKKKKEGQLPYLIQDAPALPKAVQL